MKVILFALMWASVATAQTTTAQTTGTVTIQPLGAIVENKKTVEPLSPTEKKALDEARENLKKAQAEFDGVELSIRYAHGQSQNYNCGPSETLVTIWADYALIDKHPAGSCIIW